MFWEFHGIILKLRIGEKNKLAEAVWKNREMVLILKILKHTIKLQ